MPPRMTISKAAKPEGRVKLYPPVSERDVNLIPINLEKRCRKSQCGSERKLIHERRNVIHGRHAFHSQKQAHYWAKSGLCENSKELEVILTPNFCGFGDFFRSPITTETLRMESPIKAEC